MHKQVVKGTGGPRHTEAFISLEFESLVHYDLYHDYLTMRPLLETSSQSTFILPMIS